MSSGESRNFTIAVSFFVVFMVKYLVSANCRSLEFRTIINGKSLANHTIRTIQPIKDDRTCKIQCYMEPLCFAVNFCQKPDGSEAVCEMLNNTATIINDQDLVDKQECTVYISKSSCSSSPCPSNASCHGDFLAGPVPYKCICPAGVTGKFCESVLANCLELLSAGYTADGVYHIDPDGQGSFPVYCDMTTDGGEWTVFQRNRKDSFKSFNRTWQEYKTGFGNQTDKFWLGLENIYRLTKTKVASLRVDVEDLDGKKGYAVYSSFSIADESDFYRLHVSGYSGTAGDSLTTGNYSTWISNNRRFTTLDKDNDAWPGGSCALDRRAGWWFGWCSIADLNGAIAWWTFNNNLKNTEMKLK